MSLLDLPSQYSDLPTADPDIAEAQAQQRRIAAQQTGIQQQQAKAALEIANEQHINRVNQQQALGQTMASDVAQWAHTPEYAGQDFQHISPEYSAYLYNAYPSIANQIPQAVNEAARAETGNPDLGAPAIPPGTPIQRSVHDGKTSTSYMSTTPVSTSGQPESEDPMAGLSDDQKQIAQGILAYKIPPQTLQGLQRRNPVQWQQMEAALLRADPNFDSNQYPTRAAMMKSFASGQDAANIASANTAIGHLNDFLKAGNSLGNRDFQPWNYIANKAEEAGGNAAQTRFKQTADALASEMAKLFKGTGAATNQEITEWRHNLSPNMSPDQIRAAAENAMELMSSRLDALNTKYQNGMGKPLTQPILSPKSRAILRQNNINIPEAQNIQQGTEVAQPQGSQLSPEDQAAINWAKANPKDPRATQILNLHGIK